MSLIRIQPMIEKAISLDDSPLLLDPANRSYYQTPLNIKKQQQNFSINVQTKPKFGQNILSQFTKKLMASPQPQNEKQSSFFKVSREIFPSIIIIHTYKNKQTLKTQRFYECSACSYTVRKIRIHNCTKSSLNMKFTYLTPENKSRIKMRELIHLLLKPDKTLLSPEQKQDYMNKYQEWLQQGRTHHIEKTKQTIKKKSLYDSHEKINNLISSDIQKIDKMDKMLSQKILKLELKHHELLTLHEKITNTPEQIQKERVMRNNSIDLVYQKCSGTIQSVVKGQIARSFMEKSVLSPEQLSMIMLNINIQISKFSLPEPFLDWKAKLDKYITDNRLSNESENKKYARDKIKAIDFLKRIPPAFLSNISLLTSIFKLQPHYIQQYANSVLKQIKATYALNIPDISRNIKIKIIKKQKKIINLNQIKRHIAKTIKEQSHQLGVDLWFCTCLGLRLNDLKRIYVKNSNNQYYDMISVVEEKNNHNTTRCIPNSLKQLIYWSNNIYPISQSRLRQVSKYCLEHFGSFYNLRHTLLTQTISGLLKSSNFNPHSSTNTTLKFYVDYSNYQLIDQIFHLSILNLEVSGNNFKSGLRADFKNNNKVIESQINSSFQTEIDLPNKLSLNQQEINDNYDISLLRDPKLKQYEQRLAVSRSITSKQKLVKELAGDYFQYLLLIYFSTYCSLFRLIASALQQELIVSINKVNVVFKSDGSRYFQQCKTLSQNQFDRIWHYGKRQRNTLTPNPIKKSVEELEEQKAQMKSKRALKNNFKDQVLDQQQRKSQSFLLPKFKKKTNQIKQTDKTLIDMIETTQYPFLQNVQQTDLSVDNYYDQIIVIVSEHLEGKNRKLSFAIMKGQIILPKIQKSSRIKVFKNRLQLKREGTCANCHENLQLSACQNCSLNQYVAYCKCISRYVCQCEKIQRKTQSQSIFYCYQGINSPLGAMMLDKFLMPRFLNDGSVKLKNAGQYFRNNIKLVVEQSNRMFLRSMGSSYSMSQKLFLPVDTAEPSLSKALKEIRQKQQLLPFYLSYKENTRENNNSKKYVVIASFNIPKNTIIGTYNGIIKPHQEVDFQDDEILSIGWFDRTQYFITCSEGANIGTYFYCSQQQCQPNLKLMSVMVAQNDFCPFFVTTKNIQKDQELIWNYGNLYPNYWI